jgi:hypothetical protein
MPTQTDKVPRRSEVVRLVRIFVSCPGDVVAERKCLDEVINRINEIEGTAKRIRLELWHWGMAIPFIKGPRVYNSTGSHQTQSPQVLIDEQTPCYDVYFGIMSTRFGHPTGSRNDGSGTEHEYREAVERWGEHGRPWILFFFREDAPVPKKLPALREYERVVRFKEELEGVGLVETYRGIRGKRSFREQSDACLRKLLHLVAADADTVGDSPTAVIPTTNFRPISEEYRAWLLRYSDSIDVLRLRKKHGQSVKLNTVYVPLTARWQPSAEMGERRRFYGPDVLLELLGKYSLYLSGSAGSGKSTFCRWVAWLICNGAMPLKSIEVPNSFEEIFPKPLENLLPLLVPLREFWQHLPSKYDVRPDVLATALVNWVRQARLPGLDPLDVRDRLDAGGTLIILDGIDEVPRSRDDGTEPWSPRDALLAALRQAVPRWISCNNRILLTSRPYGLDESEVEALGLTIASIDELPQSIRQALVHRWFTILADDSEKARGTADEMTEHIQQREGVADLIGNPMLLTAMCILYAEGKRLPHDKYDLYSRIVDNVIYSRYPNDLAMMDKVRARLNAIAYGMHTGIDLNSSTEVPQVEITYDEIDRLLVKYKEKQYWKEAVSDNTIDTRDQLLSRTGLLLPRSSRRAGFYHFSFQEFMAAERLVDIEYIRLGRQFRKHARVPEWRNTLALAFGAVLAKSSSPERAIKLLDKLVRIATASQLGLMVVIADCIQILLGRKLRLQQDVEQKFIAECLQGILTSSPVGQRVVLANTLGHLGDPRINNDLRNSLGYIEVAAGDYGVGEANRTESLEHPLLLSRYPVTNSQFSIFMESDPYKRPDCWSVDGKRWLAETRVSSPEFWNNSKWNAPNQPVVGISFWEAEAFCHWAGGRLPTEWEWEMAARGKNRCEYPWCGSWSDSICNSLEAGIRATSPVGIFPLSSSKEFGLEDMLGNVWEWCTDPYKTGLRHRRVLRGGSFNTYKPTALMRERGDPDGRADDIGFRVVRLPERSA